MIVMQTSEVIALSSLSCVFIVAICNMINLERGELSFFTLHGRRCLFMFRRGGCFGSGSLVYRSILFGSVPSCTTVPEVVSFRTYSAIRRVALGYPGEAWKILL